MENRLSDLWSLFDFLSPGLLGSAEKFKRFLKTLDDDGRRSYAPLRNLVGPYILRRLKTDKSIISDLPDKTEIKVFCGLAPEQAALYSRSVDELKRLLKEVDGIQRRGLVLSFLLRFKQICNHPSQLLGDGEYAPDKSGKFDRLRTICDEIASRQEKVLVFTQFREMTDPIGSFLAEVFEQPGLVLHGGTTVSKRKGIVDRLELKILIQAIKANDMSLKNAYGNIVPTPVMTFGHSITGNPPTGPKLHGYHVTANLELPVLDRQQGNIARLRATIKSLRMELAAEKNTIIGEVCAAYQKMVIAREKIRVYQDSVLAQSNKVARMARLSYEAGQSDITSALTAQQANVQVRSQYLDAVNDYQLALTELEQSIGEPLQ